MRKIEIETLSNVVIGSNDFIMNNQDFTIDKEKNKINYKEHKIEYTNTPNREKKKLKLMPDTLIKFTDSKLKDKYAMIEKDTTASESLYVIFNNEEEVDSWLKNNSAENNKNSKNNIAEEKSFWDMSIKNYKYYNGVLNNRIRILPYNGENFYIPGSSLKGAMLRQMDIVEKDIKSESLLELYFNDLKIKDEDLLITVINQIKRADMQDSDELKAKAVSNVEVKPKTRVLENETNIKMTIKKGTKMELEISDNLYEAMGGKSKEISGKTINKLTFISKKIKELNVEIIKEVEEVKEQLEKETEKNKKPAIQMKLDKVKNTNRSMKELHENIDKVKDCEYKNNEILCFLGGNKGKQAIYETEIDKYGINFVNNQICGLIKINLEGVSNE